MKIQISRIREIYHRAFSVRQSTQKLKKQNKTKLKIYLTTPHNP